MARKTGSHSEITGPKIKQSALELFARYVTLMTGRDSISHLCLAAVLAGAYPTFLSARDLRAAVGTDMNSQPAEELSGQAQLDQRAKALRRRDLTGE